MNDNKNLAIFDTAILLGEATWWKMELPSGKVLFGDAKTEMLGYPPEQFKVYQDFTSLVHPDDYEKMMKAMMDLLEGRAKSYVTTYRIKASSGEYLIFYDYGEISQRDDKTTTMIGFVKKVRSLEDIDNEITEFKDLLTKGDVTIVDLFGKLQD